MVDFTSENRLHLYKRVESPFLDLSNDYKLFQIISFKKCNSFPTQPQGIHNERELCLKLYLED